MLLITGNHGASRKRDLMHEILRALAQPNWETGISDEA